MNRTENRFIMFITGQLPNSRPVNISEFCQVIQNNLGFEINGINKFETLAGCVAYDYKNLFKIIKEDQKQVIYYYFTN